MRRPYYLEHPDELVVDAEVLDRRPGAVLLDRSPFFPGGGGQLADRGMLSWSGRTAAVIGFVADEHGIWHQLDGGAEPCGPVRLEVDRFFRHSMCELHTLAHILNAIVYDRFGGALLTGAQLGPDSMFRVDFDLPGITSGDLKALEVPMNDAVRRDLPVRTDYMPYRDAERITGLFRSKAVAPPPTADGMVRIVEIGDLDRQACGGTHLASTGLARAARIVRIDNKGRHNRRFKVSVGSP